MTTPTRKFSGSLRAIAFPAICLSIALWFGASCSSESGGGGDGPAGPSGDACTRCHGSDDNAGPPKSTTSASDTTDIEIGAHQTHLQDNSVRAAIRCQECHIVPTTVDAPTHDNGQPAEVTFGTLATTNGAIPTWDHDTATCSGVYCHGATLSDGSNQSPVWTLVDGSQAFCGSCHGIPPLPPHPADYQCVTCHADTMLATGGIDIAGGRHINGVVDTSDLPCNGCHGGADNAAPPRSTIGAGATSDLAVGAHQSHLSGSAMFAPVSCDACHLVPSSAGDSGHIDASPAEVLFGALASNEGAQPRWDRNAATCSDTYCHGATLGGGSNTTPMWTRVDGTEATCDSCHGQPPDSHQPTSTFCPACHVNVTSGTPAMVNIKSPILHGNGQLDF